MIIEWSLPITVCYITLRNHLLTLMFYSFRQPLYSPQIYLTSFPNLCTKPKLQSEISWLARTNPQTKKMGN